MLFNVFVIDRNDNTTVDRYESVSAARAAYPDNVRFDVQVWDEADTIERDAVFGIRPTSRICFSNLQTQALVSLLVTENATGESIDIAPSGNSYGTIRVTVWKKGDSISWDIALSGDTKKGE